ncbi:MAG: hypothetical protein QM571_02985 [Micrococcaceae bacterium]
MIVDTKKIMWLLSNHSAYSISKETGIAIATLSRLKNGKAKLENITIASGVKLTALSDKLKTEEYQEHPDGPLDNIDIFRKSIHGFGKLITRKN